MISTQTAKYISIESKFLHFTSKPSCWTRKGLNSERREDLGNWNQGWGMTGSWVTIWSFPEGLEREDLEQCLNTFSLSHRNLRLTEIVYYGDPVHFKLISSSTETNHLKILAQKAV